MTLKSLSETVPSAKYFYESFCAFLISLSHVINLNQIYLLKLINVLHTPKMQFPHSTISNDFMVKFIDANFIQIAGCFYFSRTDPIEFIQYCCADFSLM